MQSPCSVGSITTTDASLDERCTQMRVLRTGFVASTGVIILPPIRPVDEEEESQPLESHEETKPVKH